MDKPFDECEGCGCDGACWIAASGQFGELVRFTEAIQRCEVWYLKASVFETDPQVGVLRKEPGQ